MNITVVGAGYVGMSLATLLAEKNNVIILDVLKEKVDLINKKISPIHDEDINKFLKNRKLSLEATIDKFKAYKNPDFIIIATPTDYNHENNSFDTTTVDNVIKDIIDFKLNSTVIIKSTVPIGYTDNLIRVYEKNNIIFSPEFLREGKALYDNLHPSRIVIGENSDRSREFVNLLLDGAIAKGIPVVCTSNREAESIKLFSNTYLAMRVSFFNELDTFAEINKLDTKSIIDGICLDPRIGNYYNNPSFGYGGYCLPKDTKQLLYNYQNIPNSIIEATVKSNDVRKNHIFNMIKNKGVKNVGIFRLVMKSGSDNFRSAAIFEIIDKLKRDNIDIFVYEPIITSKMYEGLTIINDIKLFKEKSQLIITNRFEEELFDVIDKVYTRDIYFRE